MKLAPSTINQLDISSALAPARDLDRFPPLLSDTCVVDAAERLVAQITAMFTQGTMAPTETLSMPRVGLDAFGQRPVTLGSLPARSLYVALINSMGADLPPSSRRADRWKDHAAFGTSAGPQQTAYLVEFDIASCYEYIDHVLLSEELLTRTLSVPKVQGVMGLLGDMFPRGLGLPQMTPASDVLADAYLEIIERSLLRSGHTVSRYADDFKVLANSWGEATDILEEASESARSVGLILSTEKTKVRKASTINEQDQQKTAFLYERFESARQSLTELQLAWDHYGEQAEFMEIPPEEVEVVEQAFLGVLREWYQLQEADVADDELELHARFLAPALKAVRESDTRVPDEWLAQMVFRRPLSLERVCDYILARRDEHSDNWRLLKRLTSIRRQSPWAKVWLIHVADAQPSEDSEHEPAVRSWTREQLGDRHELVRSEAAWRLAGVGAITVGELAALYRRASSVTRPGIAAALGRATAGDNTNASQSLTKGDPMGKLAFDWGAHQGAPA